MPKGWLIPANPRLTAAIERLRWHGLKVEEVTTSAQVSVERFTISDYTRAERPACVPPARARERRWVCDVEHHRRRAGGGTDLPDLPGHQHHRSQDEITNSESGNAKSDYFPLR